ncbi:hypothetical protein [Thalassotalea agarivorans]|uniref:Uncharacterized protein n=1 Tax=Thalassotalea agarivorans TaxID=349064 RepID=A0A1I0GS36_THASX|nr:hypothetical protein [Thalassotalea agarivorans]SET74158.1 hypothetical protein SAMN05660429_02545 [Thalassotalea agarivorans]
MTAVFAEVPFQYRHHCWFCNEPSGNSYTFPNDKQLVLQCVHPQVTVPCCDECKPFAQGAKGDNLWHITYAVKNKLHKKYRKHLAIGLNWTKEELEQSEFDGGNFEGFKRSAWFMFEVALARVNFQQYPLIIEGIEYKPTHKSHFIFDGVTYPSIDVAISHYSKNFDLDQALLRKALFILGDQSFSRAVSFCRLMVGATPQEKQAGLKSLF